MYATLSNLTFCIFPICCTIVRVRTVDLSFFTHKSLQKKRPKNRNDLKFRNDLWVSTVVGTRVSPILVQILLNFVPIICSVLNQFKN